MIDINIKVTNRYAVYNLLNQGVKNFRGKALKNMALSLSKRMPYVITNQILKMYGRRGNWNMQNQYAWEVRTRKVGDREFRISVKNIDADVSVYADYLDNPSGPYPGKVNRKALKSWMKKRGYYYGRDAVRTYAKFIETSGHDIKTGKGYQDKSIVNLLEEYSGTFEYDVEKAFNESF